MTVYLVGAGPGHPGLMTARAIELIASADVVLYDRLIPEGALEFARPDAELLYVGKEGGGPSRAQEETERLLIERGNDQNVVRLKGGDPFVFGRGGEEADALHGAGIPYEVVPGVTAGVAAPAFAGIPVTHRGLSSAVAMVTGHEDPAKGEEALDFRALAGFPGTLVVYMGVRQLEAITRRLHESGRDGDEPAAVIERATLPDQRVISGTLGTIAELAASEGLRAPAVAVFGAVAALTDGLSWFQAGPLAGITVAVTRARPQVSELAGRLRALGARVLEAPAIRIVALDGPAPSLSQYDLICLTSANGVRLLFERLRQSGLDARALAGTRVAAIGPGTASALLAHGVIADVVPERSVAEGLIEALEDVPVKRALVARASRAREVLVEALRRRGARVDVLALYDTVAAPLSDRQLEAARHSDYITFTSSSTVEFFLDAVDGRLGDRIRVASIGPVTSTALRERAVEPDLEATRHDIDGLVEALVQDVAARRPG